MNYSKINQIFFSWLIFLSFSCSYTGTSSSTAAITTTQPSTEKKQIKTVLFDLGGVLFDTSHTGMGGEIGYGDCIWYSIFNFKNPANIKPIAFTLLDTIAEKQIVENGSALAIGDGLVMPGLMCRWMCGTITGPEIITLAENKIDNGSCDNLFCSSTEKRLVKKLIGAIFNPRILAKHTHPIKKGLELLKSCADQKDLTLMVLSNYAADAFEELYNREESKKVFTYFAPEKMVISGFIGTMKPYRSIYDYLKKEYHLDPTECVIIDDQKENILAAKKEGFEVIYIKKGNFAHAHKRLAMLGVVGK